MNTHVAETTGKPVTSPFSIDVSKGGLDGTVSRQWMSRPADQIFNDLIELRDSKQAARERSWECRLNSKEFDFVTPGYQDIKPGTMPDQLAIQVPNYVEPGADLARDLVVAPTHWAFSQICQLGKMPASFLRELPSPMVADVMHYRMRYAREVEHVKLYGSPTELQAMTGPTYGRIYNEEIADALINIAGDGLGGDPRFPWKTPGKIDWGSGTYDPRNIGPREDHTFYASDRDMFVFLVDDTRPIVVGKTRDGRDDHMFRGFYVQNSEVGTRSLAIKTFYLRGVCMNRNLWGCEGLEEIRIPHTRLAPERWLTQAMPALASYAQASDSKLIESVEKAKAKEIASTRDEAVAWLASRSSFPRPVAAAIYDQHGVEEHGDMRTAWDFAQGITAYARTKINTDDRLTVEIEAKKILDEVA